MRINRGNKRLCFLLVSVLVLALVGGLALSAFAAEERQGTSSFKKTWMKIWEVLNFLILAFLVFKLLRDPVKNFFRGRTEMLRQKIAEAEGASIEAERELKEVESRFEMLDEEIQRLQQTITEQGERGRDKIISDAEQTAEYMLEKAKFESEMMMREAKIRLRREVTNEAVRLAEESIKKEIGKKDQERLVDEYLQDLKQVATS
ncbi:MAG: ATP synthase F0 subunit B [Deltaproteobacteria bacterium]|nr:ATP synthase F0 subunit B [Deltaproteobacteria bacterium]